MAAPIIRPHRIATIQIEQRADAQVDVAADNDKHHPRRHDRNRHRLDCQVKDISGGQEPPARHEIKHKAQDDKSADHTQKAGVEFERGK